MKQSLHIKLEQLFGPPCPAEELDMQPHIHMPSSNMTCWKNELGEAILQEFSSMICYIYSLDIYIDTAIDIPLAIHKRSLHAIYNMIASGTIQIIDHGQQHKYALSPERAIYLYLPKGNYQLEIPAGRSGIFGFYITNKLFRDNNERPFQFLHPLIEAYRANASLPCASVEIRIGTRTQHRIRYFLRNLKKGQLANEGHILHQLYELFKLSTDKLFEDYHKLSEAAIKAQEALDLIAQHVQEYGQDFTLRDICSAMRISLDYLHDLSQTYHQMPPTELKNKLLETRIKELLMDGMQISHIAYACGYGSASAMNKFFKKRTGMTPSAYYLNNP